MQYKRLLIQRAPAVQMAVDRLRCLETVDGSGVHRLGDMTVCTVKIEIDGDEPRRVLGIGERQIGTARGIVDERIGGKRFHPVRKVHFPFAGHDEQQARVVRFGHITVG